MHGLRLVDIIRQELRYALRSLGTSRLVSAVVIATLGTGIALVTTFFSLVNTAFYHPLPYKNADRIVSLTPYAVSKPPLDELKKMSRSLGRIATFQEGRAILSGGDGAVEINSAAVDTSLFTLLDARPIVGSLPSAREIADRARVAVINERVWRGRFGGRPDIVGQWITLDGVARRVIGVMPAWFTFPGRAEVWFPLEVRLGPEDRELKAIGFLSPGATIGDVEREVQLLGARLHQIDSVRFHLGRTGGIYVSEDMVDRGRGRSQITFLIWLVVGGALCVLLVACTNVASLMLARTARRRGEMVIRASLGASRWQLIRQQLIESVILASMAGIFGTVASIWGVQLVVGMLPPQSMAWMPRWVNFGIDGRVLAFAALISLLTILVFGLWPAREATRFDLTSVLRATADHGVAGRDPTRRLHVPVVLELTLSLVLFVGAVMMLRSFHTLASVDHGFALEDRSRVSIAYERTRDTIAEDYSRNMLALREATQAAAPSVEVALVSGFFHFLGDSAPRNGFIVPETRRTLSWEYLEALPSTVSDNYFRVLRISIVAGRAFDSTDVASSTPVIVVSRRLAMDVWGSANPLGKQLMVGRHGGTRATVVGVVNDVTRSARVANGVLVPQRDIYFGERQTVTCCNRASLIIHSKLSPNGISSLVGRSLRSLGRDLPVTVMTLGDDEMRGDALLNRMLSTVFAIFAMSGLILATMGIYGVVAFDVAQRTREIGIRVALGATSADVVRHLMTGGLKLVAIATTIGLAASALTGRVLTAFVLGTFWGYVVTAVGVAAVFAAIAMLGCYLPARRAASMDPLVALRSE